MAPGNSLQRSVDQEVRKLVEEYRDRCLWFMKPDFVPTTEEEQRRALDLIVRHGDRSAYRRVMEIKRWLSPESSEQS